MRAIARVVCVQLSAVFPDFCKRLVMPDYGLPLIGSVLAEAGYDVTVVVEHVQPPQWEVIAVADAVCMSSLSAAADKTYGLADRIRAELGIPVIVGGTHATYFDRDVLQHADYVVRGEGDETVLDLVDALSTGRDPASVDGISFMREGTVVRTPPRPGPQRFDTMPDYRLIAGYTPMPRWDMLRQRRLPLVTVQSSRGCHFHCYIDGNFVTHFPRNMRPSQLQAGLVRAHQRVLSPLQVARAVGRGRPNDALQKALHRLMWSSIQKGLTDYIPWLQGIEEEFYDENDRLLEERLLERYRSGPPWSFPSATEPEPAAVMSSFIERNAGRCPAPVVAGGAIA